MLPSGKHFAMFGQFKRISLLGAILLCANGVIEKQHSSLGAETSAKKLKVLVVTGGHAFQPESFFKLFSNNPAITYTSATEENAAEAWDRDDVLDYDVVLLYDFQRELNDTQKGRFLSLFNKGVGLVVLHHALLSYPHWPEYERIAGGNICSITKPSTAKRGRLRRTKGMSIST